MNARWCAGFACALVACEQPPPPDTREHCDVSQREQALEVPFVAAADELARVFTIVELETSTLTCHPGTGAGCDELIAEQCAIDLGDVAVGSLVRDALTIRNAAPGWLSIDSVSIVGCADAYLEGVLTPLVIATDDEVVVPVVVAASDVGECAFTIDVRSNADNAPDGATLHVTANRVEGAPPVGCSAAQACCCSDPSREPPDAPVCADGRAVCGDGALLFGDRCDDVGCSVAP